MSFQTLLKIAAIVNGAHAVAFGLWTNPLFSFVGVAPDARWSLVGRLVGAMALGFVVLAISAARTTDAFAQRAICLSFLTSASAEMVLILAATSAGSTGRAWPVLASVAVQAAACSYFLLQKARQP